MRPIAILTVLALTSVARAQTPSPTPTTPAGAAMPSSRPTSSTAAPAAGEAPKATPSELDFNLFGDDKKKSPLDEAREQQRLARLEQQVRTRRKLLISHQVLGFATLAALAAQIVIGQLTYDDKYLSSGNDSGQYTQTHLWLGTGTTALFAATGIVALAAPNPYPKPIKLDAALLHKMSMAAAAAGMVLQIVLGPIISARDGKLDQRDLATTHLVAGYATFAFMATGTLAYVF